MSDFQTNRIQRFLNDSRDHESTPLPMEEEELDNVNLESKSRAGDSHSGSGHHHPGSGNPRLPSAIGNRGTPCGDDQESRDLHWSDCGMWYAVRRWCAKPHFLLHSHSSRESDPCKVTAAGNSFKGSKRKQNEDCWHVAPDCSNFVVADGMGGCPAGDVASQLAVNVLADELGKVPSIRTKRDAMGVLNRAFSAANSRVVQFGRMHDCAGLGAAVVAAVCTNNRVYVAGVGDCRAYLFRGGKLTQLTTDDTLAASLFKTGLVNSEQINRHPFKHILARCIGSNPFQPTDDVSVVDLHPDDRLVLCSDGLFNTLADAEIATVLAMSHSASEAARRLKSFAKAAYARDDTTCIVIVADSDDSPTHGFERGRRV